MPPAGASEHSPLIPMYMGDDPGEIFQLSECRWMKALPPGRQRLPLLLASRSSVSLTRE
jgi:hypothetical protein